MFYNVILVKWNKVILMIMYSIDFIKRPVYKPISKFHCGVKLFERLLFYGFFMGERDYFIDIQDARCVWGPRKKCSINTGRNQLFQNFYYPIKIVYT